MADGPGFPAGENRLRGVRRQQGAEHEYQDETGCDPEDRIVKLQPETPDIVLTGLVVCPITIWHRCLP